VSFFEIVVFNSFSFFRFNVEVDVEKAEAKCRGKTLFTVEGSISVR
jgi:hypothetical protein